MVSSVVAMLKEGGVVDADETPDGVG